MLTLKLFLINCTSYTHGYHTNDTTKAYAALYQDNIFTILSPKNALAQYRESVAVTSPQTTGTLLTPYYYL